MKYTTEIAALILFIALGFSHYKAYKFGEEHMRNVVTEQRQLTENEKQKIEKEQNDKYEMAQIGYTSALDILNDKLRNAEIVPRRTSVCMADSVSNQGSVSRASEDTSGTVTSLKTYQGTSSVNFYEDAMRDNLQCQSLIDFLAHTPAN